MTTEKHELLRALPQVNEVLRRPEVAALGHPRRLVVQAVRAELEERRRAILVGRAATPEIDAPAIARRAARLGRPSLRRVINATGVVLHTNLGRAPLAPQAVARVAEIAGGYSNLEYDLDERTRGSRHDHLRALLAELTGAESALVVNNNAAAVLVALAALAAGRDVVVSRGELIEIGGSFRIPDVMRASGARLVEVGTTNKTHPRDYEAAIGSETGLLLKVHRSNFVISGFTAEVEAPALVALGRARGVAVMIDLGSGTLLDPAGLGVGLPREPTVPAAVASGAALVTFSGDKLLGGPQAGILVGAEETIARVRRHPLVRAVRPDKMTLAALEATLEAYRDGDPAARVPAVRMLAATREELAARAGRLAAALGPGPATGALAIAVVEAPSAVGGGALPEAAPPSFALAVSATDGRSAEELDAALRGADPPVIGRIADGRLLLDVRTIADAELEAVARAVRAMA